MLYFDNLPKVVTPDQNGNNIILTNIITRAALIEQLKNNPMLFYKYNIQDGDTPEILAEKYYDDPYRYWIILYSNEILDPLWDWPKTDIQFRTFIESKYAAEAAAANMSPYEYTQVTVYDYVMVRESTDNTSGNTTTIETSLTEDQYNSLSGSTNVYTLPDGQSCTVVISKKIVTIYDYEYDLNETKREIKILDSNFAGQFEQQFKQLMSGS